MSRQFTTKEEVLSFLSEVGFWHYDDSPSTLHGFPFEASATDDGKINLYINAEYEITRECGPIAPKELLILIAVFMTIK